LRHACKHKANKRSEQSGDRTGDLAAVKSIARELKDRFGKPPPAAARLIRLAELRVECAAAQISHIDAKGNRAVFYRNGSREIAFVATLRSKTADRKIAELVKAVRN
jgi:transcription-repair coupling factor (superfamily II helicase)